jgi:hypothetical protein
MLQRQKKCFLCSIQFFFAKATLPKKLAIEIGIVTNSLKYKFQLQIQVASCQVNNSKKFITTNVTEGITKELT